jgi:hypothetical protein
MMQLHSLLFLGPRVPGCCLPACLPSYRSALAGWQRAIAGRDVPGLLERVATQLKKEKHKGLQPCLKVGG